MSGYEDYSRVSTLYDETRGPVGAEIILGCLVSGATPLEDVVLVDAGCGTGNYAQALLPHVARIEAVDLNQAMLDRARAKLSGESEGGRVGFHRAPIDALPLESHSADAIMINQVLHHVDDDASAGWPAVRAVVGEFARVLRPGGTLVVNVCSHEQITRGWWYMPLIPKAVERMRDRHVPLNLLESIMSENGLEPAGRFVPVDAVMQGPGYFDGRVLLDERWRAGDSLWAMVSARTLESVIGRIEALDAAGELDAFVREHDAHRRHIGQLTFVCARKASQP